MIEENERNGTRPSSTGYFFFLLFGVSDIKKKKKEVIKLFVFFFLLFSSSFLYSRPIFLLRLGLYMISSACVVCLSFAVQLCARTERGGYEYISSFAEAFRNLGVSPTF